MGVVFSRSIEELQVIGDVRIGVFGCLTDCCLVVVVVVIVVVVVVSASVVVVITDGRSAVVLVADCVVIVVDNELPAAEDEVVQGRISTVLGGGKVRRRLSSHGIASYLISSIASAPFPLESREI